MNLYFAWREPFENVLKANLFFELPWCDHLGRSYTSPLSNFGVMTDSRCA